MSEIEARRTCNAKQSRDVLLRAVSARQQKAIAAELEWSESKLSRLLGGDATCTFDEFLSLVACADVALVAAPDGYTTTIARTHYHALLTFAGERADMLRAEVARG